MSDIKFIGLDVHKTSVAVAVLDDNGKLAMRSVLLTQASAILAFIRGLRGTLRVTFEEGDARSLALRSVEAPCCRSVGL